MLGFLYIIQITFVLYLFLILIKDVAYVLRAEKKNIVARFEHERSKSERKLAKRKEGESGNSGRPEKQRASVVAGGGALRTLDWDTSAINLSV